MVDTGEVEVFGNSVAPTALAYLPSGSATIELHNCGQEAARFLFIGGEPFEEKFIMWWNFIGRSHEEIFRFREEWEAKADRFGHVDGYIARSADGPLRLPAPVIPPVELKPR